MKKIPINQEVIFSRMREIEKNIDKLTIFKGISLENFKKGENYAIAEHYLRRALELSLILEHISVQGFPEKDFQLIKMLLFFWEKRELSPNILLRKSYSKWLDTGTDWFIFMLKFQSMSYMRSSKIVSKTLPNFFNI